MQKIQENGYPEELQRLLNEMLSPVLKDKLPAVLPLLDTNKQLWFYIVSSDAQQLTELRGVVNAYLGRTFISLDLMEHHDSNYAHEKKLIEYFSDGFLRLNIHKVDNENKEVVKKRAYWVIQALNQLIQQFHERPVILSVIKRPVGRILRDFFIAYNNCDYESSVIYYAELENRQLLSKRNLIFLKLQTLAISYHWNKLLEDPQLPVILSGRLPRRITLIILRAFLATSLDIENFDDHEINDVRRKITHLDALFFREPDIARSSGSFDEWKCWSIGAVTVGYGRVLEALPEGIDVEWKTRLSKWGSLNDTATQPLPEILSIEGLIQESPSLDIASKLLQETVLAGIEIQKAIYNRLDGYPDELLA